MFEFLDSKMFYYFYQQNYSFRIPIKIRPKSFLFHNWYFIKTWAMNDNTFGHFYVLFEI